MSRMAIRRSDPLQSRCHAQSSLEGEEHSLQRIIAGRASQSPKLGQEQLVEGRLQHELERNEGFAPVPRNEEDGSMISRNGCQIGSSCHVCRALTPNSGWVTLQLTHPVSDPLDAPHFVRSLECGGDGDTCTRGHITDVGSDHLQAVTGISKWGELRGQRGPAIAAKDPGRSHR